MITVNLKKYCKSINIIYLLLYDLKSYINKIQQINIELVVIYLI